VARSQSKANAFLPENFFRLWDGCETKLPKGKKRAVFFALATACALPFALVLSLLVVGLFARSKPLADAFLFSVFLSPLFLLVTAAGLVFIPLAWTKGRRAHRPLLILYVLIIAAYWKLMTMFGPW
jgi:hypothetical protein